MLILSTIFCTSGGISKKIEKNQGQECKRSCGLNKDLKEIKIPIIE